MKSFFKNGLFVFLGGIAGSFVASTLMMFYYFNTGVYSSILDGAFSAQPIELRDIIVTLGRFFFILTSISVLSTSLVFFIIFCIFAFFNKGKVISEWLLLLLSGIGVLLVASLITVSDIMVPLGQPRIRITIIGWVMFVIWTLTVNFVIFHRKKLS